MNTRPYSPCFSASLALAILGNLLFAKKMLAIGLVLAVLGVGILAHGFFEEKSAWGSFSLIWECLRHA